MGNCFRSKLAERRSDRLMQDMAPLIIRIDVAALSHPANGKTEVVQRSAVRRHIRIHEYENGCIRLVAINAGTISSRIIPDHIIITVKVAVVFGIESGQPTKS